MAIDVFAPAKVNLTLHVTNRRADGYHELDSLVVFANVGDVVSATLAASPKLTVKGPMRAGVPTGRKNLVLKAADLIGVTADIRLEKHLPNAAGVGGGSSDAAATLTALSILSGKRLPENTLELGADVPVCLTRQAARMRGVGDILSPVPDLPVLHAVLVNPRIPVLTAEVFRRLARYDNAPMPETIPQGASAEDFIGWLGEMRNDLEAAAIEAEPVIQQVFDTLSVTPGCRLTRMSGSGGTCFGLYADGEMAASAAGRLQEGFPGWWVTATRLNEVQPAPAEPAM